MTLNIAAFGMGLGVVLAGALAGLVVGFVFSIIRRVGNI